MSKDDLFLFKLGHSISTRKDPEKRLMIVERLFVEFLDKDKPRRVMYACRNSDGVTELLPQQTLVKWDGTRKTLQKHTENKIGEIVSQIRVPSRILG